MLQLVQSLGSEALVGPSEDLGDLVPAGGKTDTLGTFCQFIEQKCFGPIVPRGLEPLETDQTLLLLPVLL